FSLTLHFAMDNDYDNEFPTYSTSSTPNTSQWTSALDQDNDVSVSFSQSPLTPLISETSNSNNNTKRVKLFDKPGLVQFFFEFYELPGTKPDDKPITKAKCKIEGCQIKYVWHGSTTNIVNHLCDVHHITKTSLEHSSVEELKKFSQQTIESTLLKPYSVSRQQKLTRDIVKFLISCVTCHWISDEFRIYDLTLGVIEMGAYKTADDIVDSIEPILEEFGLEGSKILSITTDNGSNVKLAVTRLSARLSNSNNNDYHRDGANIRDKLLSNKEFKVVQALVELLCPFDKATEILSRSNYATLSIMVPTIEELVYRLNNTNTDFDLVNE
ncbi:31122_t:CDS:2, partial [Gigaspora margarita]